MKQVSATQAKQRFGPLIDQVQQGAVTITSHGRPVAVMISAQSYDEALEGFFASRLPKWNEARARVLADGGMTTDELLRSFD